MIRTRSVVLSASLAFAFALGCGTAPKGTGQDAGPSTLVVEPATITLDVVNGVQPTQDYTANLVAPDGTRTDVTDQVSFILDDSAIGYFDHHTLTATGAGAGQTTVRAGLPGVQGTAQVKVLVHGSRVDPSAPADAPALFGAAATDTAKQVAIAYPPDQVIVPQNLGDFEVHWRDGSGDNLFEVTLRDDFTDLRIYVAGGATGWGKYLPAEWSSASHGAGDLTVIVRGLDTAAPQTAGISAPITVHLTNEAILGGLYYWAAAGGGEGIWRHDMSKPGDPPEKFFTTTETPAGRCVACHSLSRDGTKMAVTYDGGNKSATILDVATLTPAIAPDTMYWNFATFTPDATKLLTVFNGQLTLRNAANGDVLATVQNTSVASHPDFAPQGDKIVYVQRSAGSDWEFTGGNLVVQSYDPVNVTFGDMPTPLVTGGGNNFYPSFSPDGQWVLFNRTDNNEDSYNAPTAELWVVKADGSAPPMKLAAADIGPGLTNSWARWAPFQSSFGPNNEPLYWITFSSKREFGVRSTAALNNLRPQIWMTPFFPARMTGGTEPTAPSFRLPFQDIGTNNHIAQWTERVVPVN
ncbi:MAG: hypothetical protein K8W52_29445 [Deltaproteobacteria bacterium]|nr:hypothetical protein [Deltaproteobacteria bacterium]